MIFNLFTFYDLGIVDSGLDCRSKIIGNKCLDLFKSLTKGKIHLKHKFFFSLNKADFDKVFPCNNFYFLN